MNRFQPIQKSLAIAIDQAVLAGEWRVPDNSIEAAAIARHDFGEFDFPMERLDRPLARSQRLHVLGQRFFKGWRESCTHPCRQFAEQFIAFVLAGAVRGFGEESRDCCIPDETNERECFVGQG